MQPGNLQTRTSFRPDRLTYETHRPSGENFPPRSLNSVARNRVGVRSGNRSVHISPWSLIGPSSKRMTFPSGPTGWHAVDSQREKRLVGCRTVEGLQVQVAATIRTARKTISFPLEDQTAFVLCIPSVVKGSVNFLSMS